MGFVPAATASGDHISHYQKIRVSAATVSGRVFFDKSLKKILGANYWWALRPQIKYSPESIQGVVDRMVFCTFLLDDNRNRNVAYFYWDDKSQRWVLNFNWDDNNFNRNDRFLVPR